MLTIANAVISFAPHPHTTMAPATDSWDGGGATPDDPNPCAGAKPKDAAFTDADGVLDESRTIPGYFENRGCAEMMDIGFGVNLGQSGMDVTADGTYGEVAMEGTLKAAFDIGGAITGNYADQDPPLCPVNVHWHLGAEHRSAGEYDEAGSGPCAYDTHECGVYSHDEKHEAQRQGMLCHHYDAGDAKFTDEYEWKYCKDMQVGQTYEVHWPHSAAGECGNKWQMQTPFYDGVFCKGGIISLGDNPPFNVPHRVGVQGQVFTIVNSDAAEYTNMELFKGAWVDDTHWADVAKYLGSTTGQSRDADTTCSMYAPITWQVDRKCHMLSAASMDQLCKDMKYNDGDDLSPDTHPHGSRELVDDKWTSDTVHRRE